MAKSGEAGRYVILPPQGLRAPRGTNPDDVALLRSAHEAMVAGTKTVENSPVDMRVLDSIGPDGAKLVELSPRGALAIRASNPGLRVVPVQYYQPAVLAPERVTVVTKRPRGVTAPPGNIVIKVVSGKSATPVAGAFVVAFVDFKNKSGDQGQTGADGSVSFFLGAASVKLDRLYVYPVDANWSLVKKNLTVKNGDTVTLTPLDLSYTDGLRYFYGNPDLSAGAGVTVGVVDTGVSAHPDLVIAGGQNTVAGENPTDFASNGNMHGTHVAGIVAARGTPPKGLRGVAPGVTLRAYRVFGKNQSNADSFAIAKGVDAAVTDKCDLINMSLGGGQEDPTLKAAVDSARAGGSLCIIASGNDGRGPVSFPAFEATALAVSACGRKGTFPTNTTGADEIAAPYGTDKKNFLAEFSNIGPQIDLVAPGVDIMSTVPGGYAEISGTSMACPAATGASARAVAGNAALKLKRDNKRSDAMAAAILATAAPLGFGPNDEGHGMPQPK